MVTKKGGGRGEGKSAVAGMEGEDDQEEDWVGGRARGCRRCVVARDIAKRRGWMDQHKGRGWAEEGAQGCLCLPGHKKVMRTHPRTNSFTRLRAQAAKASLEVVLLGTPLQEVAARIGGGGMRRLRSIAKCKKSTNKKIRCLLLRIECIGYGRVCQSLLLTSRSYCLRAPHREGRPR